MMENVILKKLNLGIELLRMIFSFLIIVFHIHSRRRSNFILFIALYFIDLYTSSFFLISFYFSFKNFTSKDIIVKKKRLQRIIIPHIIWPIFIYLENNIYVYSTVNIKIKQYSIRDLIIQLVIGRRINDVFWFQFNLIIISIFIMILMLIFSKKNSFYFLSILLIISAFFNIKKMNLIIFNSYKLSVIHSVARISFSIIYSITGLFLGSIHILEKINNHYQFIILLFSPFFIYAFNIYKKLNEYFPNYKSLFIDILIIILFIIFGLLPLKRIFKKNLFFLFRALTSFTAGVYYMHLYIYKIIIRFYRITYISWKVCIVIYLSCYLISLIFSNVFKKSSLKYLFI